jgi:hypothetical protein
VQCRSGSTYFNKFLVASPRWTDTSVLICGDHSWRISLWRGQQTRRLEGWTSEDEIASHGGVFDPRPVLMVHEAGQTTPATVSQTVPLVRVHDILDSLILRRPIPGS